MKGYFIAKNSFVAEVTFNIYNYVHTVHREIQIPIVSIINNQLDWHILYKPFNGNFLSTIKEIDYCITPSIFHFIFIFIFVMAIKENFLFPRLIKR